MAWGHKEDDMNKKNFIFSRRDFVGKSVFGGIFLGMGCPGLFASHGQPNETHKFQSPIDFTYEKLFDFTFGHWFITYMKLLHEAFDSKKFIEILTKAGDNQYRNSVKPMFKKVKDRSVQSLIESFWEPTKNSKFGGSIISIDIPQKSKDKAVVKTTECLFAKTFRKNDAGELGYAAICHADYAVANEFNPDIILKRDKCLMQGHDCCLFNYSMKHKS